MKRSAFQLSQIDRNYLPGWELTFICCGHDFKAFVRARNTEAATEEALIELAQHCPDFEPSESRLVRAVQTH